MYITMYNARNLQNVISCFSVLRKYPLSTMMNNVVTNVGELLQAYRSDVYNVSKMHLADRPNIYIVLQRTKNPCFHTQRKLQLLEDQAPYWGFATGPHWETSVAQTSLLHTPNLKSWICPCTILHFMTFLVA